MGRGWERGSVRYLSCSQRSGRSPDCPSFSHRRRAFSVVGEAATFSWKERGGAYAPSWQLQRGDDPAGERASADAGAGAEAGRGDAAQAGFVAVYADPGGGWIEVGRAGGSRIAEAEGAR